MVVDDFDKAIPGGWVPPPKTSDLYVKCFETVLRNAFSMSPVMGATFVMDDKPEVKARVLRLFDHAKRGLPPELDGRLESIRFEDDKKESPLQVADLMAFEWRRRIWESRRKPDAVISPRYERLRAGFRRLAESRPPYRIWNMHCYDRTFIDGFVAVPLPSVDLSELWFSVETAQD